MNPLSLVEWLSTAVAFSVVACTMAVGVYVGRRSRDDEPSSSGDDDLTAIFDQSRDAALITEGGQIVQANSAAETMFGYPRRTLIGLPVANLLADRTDEERFIRVLSRGPVRAFPLRLRNASGDILECAITAVAKFDANGRVTGCRGLARDVTEVNRMVNELRRAEQDYRGLFDHAYDAILLLDPMHEIVLDANQRACVLYGIAREAFIGRSMVELSVNPSRGKSFLRDTRDGSGRRITFESQQLTADGTVMDVEINAVEVPYKGRRAILSINRDVTARRKAERAIRESEERFRLLLENVTDYAIVMLDPIGRVVSWNEGAQRITGYAAEEVVGESAAMFAPPDQEPSLREQLARAAQQGKIQFETTRLRKDGSSFAASVALAKIVDETGSTRGFAEVTHDITTEMQLAKAREEMVKVLSNVANEWSETFDAVRVPIILLDRAGVIRRLNRAAQTLAERPFQEVVGMSAADLDREPWSTIAEIATTTTSRTLGSTVRAVDGSFVWDVSSCVAGDRASERVIVVAYDLTVVSRLEATVRRNEVAAALGSLVAGVAHEVRNPLFTISATLDAWEARFRSDQGVAAYGRVLREQTDRLNRLMGDLLEYGKPNPLSIGSADLVNVLRAAAEDCNALAEHHSVSVVLDVAEIPRCAMDGARLEQVFQNVIDNAVRHSPAGGAVRVSARLNGDLVVCTVVDRGPGLGPVDPESLFQPFCTRRRGGTGLGLSIARKIVAAHGGEIRIANRADGAGTVVTISLPFRPVEVPAIEVRAC